MTYTINFVLTLLLLAGSFELFGQANYKVSPEQVKEELLLIKETLEETHPYLYRYLTKKEFDNSFTTMLQSVTDSLNHLEVYKILAPFVNQVKNGHTNLKPRETYLDSAKLLPLKLVELSNRYFVDRDFSGSNDDIESFELLKVNETPISEIVQEITPFVSIDGYSDTVRMKLGVEYLSYYYNLVIDQPTSFQVELLNRKNGDILKKDLAPIRYPALVDSMKLKLSDTWGLEFIDSLDVAILKISSLDFIKTLNFSKFLKHSFSEIEKNQTKTLILDIRNNRGGDLENVVELIQYLIAEPILVSKSIEVKMMTPPTHKQYTNYKELYWNRFYNEKTVTKQNEHYSLNKHFSFNQTEPQKKVFQGKLFVLMNAKTGSAAGTLVSILRRSGRSLIIGEENRASYSGFTAGTSLILTLPYSLNKVYIPLFYSSIANTKDTGRGVIPDVQVSRNWQNYFNDEDEELNYAIGLIKDSN